MADGSTFGVELRRARLAAGLSLADLSRLVHYSKGYLSKLENGTKAPPRDVAMRCDAAVEAGGRLVTLTPSRPVRAPVPAPPQPRTAPVLPPQLGNDELTLAQLSSMLQQARELGRIAGPRLVLPPLLAQTRLVRDLAAAARGPARVPLLALAARCAEYASWMVQETGDEPGARWWTEEAVRLAVAADLTDMVRYGHVRQAEFSLQHGQVPEALRLLAEARKGATTARVSGLVLEYEAQAHALAGDHARCEAALAAAGELLAAPDETGTALGALSAPNQHALVAGACLLELGRPAEAAEALDRELARVPAHARRVAARFGTARAIAYAAAGDPDTAVALIPDLVVLTTQIDSATVRSDLARLRHELVRWEFRPGIARARTDLADLLAPPS